MESIEAYIYFYVKETPTCEYFKEKLLQPLPSF